MVGYYDQIYYRDGFTATIIAQRKKDDGEISISTNGKGDGSSFSDMQTQKLSGHFPALFHPDPKNACVIGFGTGTTVGSSSATLRTKVWARFTLSEQGGCAIRASPLALAAGLPTKPGQAAVV